MDEIEKDGNLEIGLRYANMMTAYGKDEKALAAAHITRLLLYAKLSNNFQGAQEVCELIFKCPSSLKRVKSSKPNETFHQRLIPIAQDLKESLTKFKESRDWKNDEDKMKQRLQFTQDLSQLKSPNPFAPALESFVQIKYNEKKGRHLVVSQDVPAGTFK